MNTVITRRPNFLASAETRLIEERFRISRFEDPITYTEISGIIGYDCTTSRGRGAINSAKRRLIKEGMVFESIRGIGYKKLTGEETLSSTQRDSDHINRTAKRSLRKLETVEYSKLPDSRLPEFNCKLAQLGILHNVTSAKTTKKIEQKARESGGPLSLQRTLEAFK